MFEALSSGMFGQIDRLDSVASTNDYLKGFVGNGRARVALAREQTAGRGREDRRWVSRRDEGIYASFLVYPPWEARFGHLLNIVAALAVVGTLRCLLPPQRTVSIKEPNDVLVENRKIAGVLVELGTQGRDIQWAIVGIGLNVFQRDFPGVECPQFPPTSLFLQKSRVDALEPVAEALIGHFSELYERARSGEMEALQKDFLSLLTHSQDETI